MRPTSDGPPPAPQGREPRRTRRVLVAAFLVPFLTVLAVVAGLVAFALFADRPAPSWTDGTR